MVRLPFGLSGCLTLVVLAGCGELSAPAGAVAGPAPASGSTHVASAQMALSSPAPSSPASACQLLDQPHTRERLSGALESHLLRQCNKASAPARSAARAAKPRLAPPPEGGAAVGETDILVNDPSLDTGGTTQSETSIVVHGDVVCAAWNDAGEGFGLNGFSGFGFSLDGGRTFKDGGPMPNADGDSSFGDPSLAYSVRDSAFYYASIGANGLSFWKSNTDCQSFTYGGRIHVGFGDDKQMLAIDNTPSSPHFGRMYVGWTDFARFDDINVVSFSDDGGLSWSEPEDLPGSGSSGQGMWPAIAPNGDVYFALVNQSFVIGGLQDQWIYKAIEGVVPPGADGGVPQEGLSWVKLTDIGSGQLRPEDPEDSANCGRQALKGDIRNLSSPQIAIQASPASALGYVIHAVYPYDSDGAGPDHSNVFYRQSLDGAQSWSAELKLNDDATATDQFVPVLAVDDDGTVVVSWYDRRLDPVDNFLFDRFITYSSDGGLSWSSNERVSDVSSSVGVNFEGLAFCYHGDYDQIAVANGTAHVLWSDDRRVTETGPNPDVYYDQVAVNPSLGRLRVDHSVTRCASTLEVNLSDFDLAGAPSQDISVLVSSGDRETLTLLANVRPGTFRGSIDTTPGAPVAGDGVLQVSDGDVVTFTYQDEDTGKGEPGVASATTGVDCTAPSITGVSVRHSAGNGASVAVQTNEPSALTVNYGFSCTALNQTASSSGGAVELAALALDAKYFFEVIATDAAGNVALDNNGGRCYSFTTLSRLFTEDFEHGLGDFSIDNTAGNGNGLWHLSQGSCASASLGHSVPSTLYYGTDGACNFNNGLTEGVARSPVISLAVAQGAQVEFSYFLGTEGGGFYDRASVAVSVDGGPFQIIESNFSSAPEPDLPVRRRPDAEFVGGAKLAENSGRWQRASLDLSPLLDGLESAQIQLEFRFNSVDSAVNDFAGFYVDDVGVLGERPPVPCQVDADCADTLFCNGAETCQEGFCSPGVPVVCEETDTVTCTVAVCDEAARACVNVAKDELCDDGSFCDGRETCDPFQGCQPSTGVQCPDDGVACTFTTCRDDLNACSQVAQDFLCNDGSFCNGFETCNPTLGCQPGTPPCNDGIGCTRDECSEFFGCSSQPDDSLCDDGLFCNGAETCDVSRASCVAGEAPCGGGQVCDETQAQCTFSCFTAPNSEHVAGGRAQLLFDLVYLALGSNDFLGLHAEDVTSLQGGGNFWELTNACPAPPQVDALEVQVVGSTVFVNGAASDINSDLSSVLLNFNIFGVPFVLAADGTDTFSAVVPLLPVGTHTVTAQAFDRLGFASEPSAPVFFTVLPPFPPTVDSISVAQNHGEVEVSGSASDPNNDIDVVVVTVLQSGKVVTSGDAFTTQPWSVTFRDLAPGNYTARAQAFDTTGLASALSIQVPFTVPQPDGTQCITASNAQHEVGGRARALLGNRFFFALGSNDFLGVNAAAVTSLVGSGSFWELTPSCNQTTSAMR